MGDLASSSDASSRNETQNAQVALNAGGVGISSSQNVTVTTADPEVVRQGIELAKATQNASYETVMYALDALGRFQDRALVSAERATEAAQTIALTATPPSAGAYAEAAGGQIKTILLATGIGALFLVMLKK